MRQLRIMKKFLWRGQYHKVASEDDDETLPTKVDHLRSGYDVLQATHIAQNRLHGPGNHWFLYLILLNLAFLALSSILFSQSVRHKHDNAILRERISMPCEPPWMVSYTNRI